MQRLTPVIMAGGSGTRLWPLSRKASPKQFHALVGEDTMLAATLARVSGEGFAPPVVIGSGAHREVLEAGLAAAAGARLVLEPMGRNTAAAAIVAALMVQEEDPDGLVLLLPADHHITDQKAFVEAVGRGVAAAQQGYLVTLGITPDRPETGYGYIRRGAQLTEGTFAVSAFVEKPGRPKAEEYLAEGNYSWNAGIFLYRASDLLAEAATHAPDILEATRHAFGGAVRDGAVTALGEEAFARVRSDSIDYAIMEKTSRAAVVSPVTIGWNDVGSWAAVRDLSAAATVGEVVAIDCRDTLIRATDDAPMVAAVGLEGIVVVATRDAVLVLPADRSQDVKKVIDDLTARGRTDLL